MPRAPKTATEKPVAKGFRPVRRTAPAVADPVPKPAGGPSATMLLGLLAAALLWWQNGGKLPDILPGPKPAPPAATTPAAAVFRTLAKLQSENYASAATDLKGGKDVIPVNEELAKKNKAAVDAAYAPLDTYFVEQLQGKDGPTTAAVYETVSKEMASATDSQ